jgi:hypothetical protein
MATTATTYDVLLLDGTGCGTRARKDAAIKLGNMQDGHFTVVSQPSGKTVHDSRTDGAKGTDDTETPAEAPAPAETPAEAPAPAETTKKEKPVTTKATTKKAPAKKAAEAPAPKATEDKRPSNELEFSHGAKYFTRQMADGAAAVAERDGLELSLEKNMLVVRGGDAKARKALLKEVDSFLTAMYAAFKEWKRSVKDKRAEWYGTPEGRKAMTAAETKFFSDYTDRYLAGEIDDAEGVI